MALAVVAGALAAGAEALGDAFEFVSEVELEGEVEFVPVAEEVVVACAVAGVALAETAAVAAVSVVPASEPPPHAVSKTAAQAQDNAVIEKRLTDALDKIMTLSNDLALEVLKSKSFIRALLCRNGSWKYLNSPKKFRGVNKNINDVANRRHAYSCKKEKGRHRCRPFFFPIEIRQRVRIALLHMRMTAPRGEVRWYLLWARLTLPF